MSYGAEKILLNSRTRQSRRQSILEVSGANKENSETNILQSLAYQDHKKQSCEGFSSSKATSSSINPISAEICQRIGKENIIEFKRRKSQQRLTNILE